MATDIRVHAARKTRSRGEERAPGSPIAAWESQAPAPTDSASPRAAQAAATRAARTLP